MGFQRTFKVTMFSGSLWLLVTVVLVIMADHIAEELLFNSFSAIIIVILCIFTVYTRGLIHKRDFIRNSPRFRSLGRVLVISCIIFLVGLGIIGSYLYGTYVLDPHDRIFFYVLWPLFSLFRILESVPAILFIRYTVGSPSEIKESSKKSIADSKVSRNSALDMVSNNSKDVSYSSSSFSTASQNS
eukprot:TRINITY_DN5315_c0_g1_i5.p1 TRINITY_DN5315_c0_g1~~TRINITY_DN5315_c0_g1_i5.p1  ORF type:complete len:186 (-),score=8.51 TRINITY_DN5315_c0_g1_i5:92-649(-)